MALTIDSATVLRAIAEHPDAFPAVKADLDEVARKLLIKQLKAKTTNAPLLQRILKATNADTVKTILDGFSANDLSGLVKKIDPHSAFVKATSDLQPVRLHILGIADGRLALAALPEKPVKTAKAPKGAAKPDMPKIGVILESKVHSGKPKTTRAKKSV